MGAQRRKRNQQKLSADPSDYYATPARRNDLGSAGSTPQIGVAATLVLLLLLSAGLVVLVVHKALSS